MACGNYTPDALVEAFHHIPHVDINLNASTDAFSTSLTYFQVKLKCYNWLGGSLKWDLSYV